MAHHHLHLTFFFLGTIQQRYHRRYLLDSTKARENYFVRTLLLISNRSNHHGVSSTVIQPVAIIAAE
jgi:hypothetical protein